MHAHIRFYMIHSRKIKSTMLIYLGKFETDLMIISPGIYIINRRCSSVCPFVWEVDHFILIYEEIEKRTISDIIGAALSAV